MNSPKSGALLPLSGSEKSKIKEVLANRKMPRAAMPPHGTPQNVKNAAAKERKVKNAKNAVNAAAKERKIAPNGTVGIMPAPEDTTLTAVCVGTARFNPKWHAQNAAVEVVYNLYNHDRLLVDRHVNLAVGSMFSTPYSVKIEYRTAAHKESTTPPYITALYSVNDNKWHVANGINEDGKMIDAAVEFTSSTSKVKTSARFHFDHAIRNLLPYLSANFAHAAAAPVAQKNVDILAAQIATVNAQMKDAAVKIIRAQKNGTPTEKLTKLLAAYKERLAKLQTALTAAQKNAAAVDVSEDEIAKLLAA